MDSQIRLLRDTDAGELFKLRREALLDSPWAFTASPEDDLASSEDALRELLTRDSASVVFGAFAQRLVGMLGLYRASQLKARHKAFLWGMFLLPQGRGQKLGQRLLHAAVRHARTFEGVTSVHLSVSESATVARHLYESAGFRIWGVEPEAIRCQGRSVDDYHMILSLGTNARTLECVRDNNQ